MRGPAAGKRTPARTLYVTLISAAVVIALEIALKHWMAATDVVSVLFAAGGGAYLRVVAALVFVLLRLFVFLILPGLIARDLFAALVARRERPPPGSARDEYPAS